MKVRYLHRFYILTQRRVYYMGQRCISNESLGTTGFSYTLSLINGKYKMTILYTLMEFGVVRFNEMKKYIGGISYKTLSSSLKELEADKLVHREEYPLQILSGYKTRFLSGGFPAAQPDSEKKAPFLPWNFRS